MSEEERREMAVAQAQADAERRKQEREIAARLGFIIGGGGKTKIDLDVVTSEFNSIVSIFDSINGTFKTINMTFVEGTFSVWNTPSAALYIDDVTRDFNAIIDVFNQNYFSGFEEFARGVNLLSGHEQASVVNAPEIMTISKLSRTWAAQSEKFNVPENYASFTYDKLTTRINELYELIENVQGHINTIVSAGLSGQFCTGIMNAFIQLKNSTQAAAEVYNSQSAKKAVEEDEILAALKSNT